MRKDKNIQIDRRSFLLIPLLFITFVFVISGIFLSWQMRVYSERHIVQEVRNLTGGYVRSLETGYLGNKVLNEQLQERLLGSGRTVALHRDNDSTVHLQNLARSLQIDEINIYDSGGLLRYSSQPAMIGWQAPADHRLHAFANSSEAGLVEPIRANRLTGEQFMYGYYRGTGGEQVLIVQVGIAAERIHQLQQQLSVKNQLERLVQDEEIVAASFISPQFEIVHSTRGERIGLAIVNTDIREAIASKAFYSYRLSAATIEFPEDAPGRYAQVATGDIYRSFAPLYFGGNLSGYLSIDYDASHSSRFHNLFITISLTALILVYVVLIATIQTARRRNQKFARLVYFDGLTGLPNSDYLRSVLDKDLAQPRSERSALLLVNFIGFKQINMTHGYAFGNQILQEITTRLQALTASRRELLLTRLGGDRFLLYYRSHAGREELVHLAREICQQLMLPICIGSTTQHLYGHIGIVEIGSQHQNTDKLLRDALITVAQDEANTRCHYTFFNDKMETQLVRESMIETELREIIEGQQTGRLYLDYQPQVDLRTGRIYGLEALARLKTNHYGLVSPLDFITIAEKRQLIVPLGRHILREACRFGNNLHQIGYPDIRIAVNISGMQLLHDDFTNEIKEIIQQTGMNSACLELEITESILIDNLEVINQKMLELRDLQIELALDDFGTGYSSFYRLRDLGVQALKIDKAFISRININNLDNMITREIISMAHMLGLRVVAEGVENDDQKVYLIENDCDIGQGYLFSRPLPAGEVLEMMQKNITF